MGVIAPLPTEDVVMHGSRLLISLARLADLFASLWRLAKGMLIGMKPACLHACGHGPDCAQ